MMMGKIDDLLLEAMNAEVKAKDFYLGASSKAQSRAGQRFFKELADFEKHHFEKVKNIIDSRSRGAKYRSSVQKPRLREIRSEVRGEFEPNKDEIVDILNLGIKAEQEAHERYNRIAEEIDDEEGRVLFKDLAEDERRHRSLLESQFYQMSNKGTIIWE
jgi:rubrerythrin